MAIIKGQITPTWNNKFKNFPYVKQPVTDKELQDWRKMGYMHDSFTGVMYSGKNPMPDWVYDIASMLNLSNPGFVFYKMTTGDIMPTHVDHFRKYCEIFNVDRESVRRAVIFLEDWKTGHYFDIGGEAIVNYKAGTYVVWDCNEPHFAANIGVEDRYTLQITGV